MKLKIPKPAHRAKRHPSVIAADVDPRPTVIDLRVMGRPLLWEIGYRTNRFPTIRIAEIGG
jgi:hypothetical protein